MTGELLGQTLGERYHFEELLGEGSFARVYRITDQHRRATLAAKVLRHDIAQDRTFLERFRREAAVLARLQHPNIVRYYDTVETDETIFILMDYIPGTSLETVLINAAGPIKPHDSLTHLTPLASALHFAHHEGIIHRDLKPANILLHDNGTLYVTDFGIARILNMTSDLTMGISIGTPFYMAPEQITGDPVTIATDIYALGVILYRMVTRHLPFRGERPGTSGTSTASRTAYEHVHLRPEPPTNLNPDLDLAVQEVVLRCLEKNPARRYHSVSQLYDALAEAVGAPPM
jgi:serine/threonine protein kinase